MSLFQQAQEVSFVRSKPMQTFVLTDATAKLDEVQSGPDVERQVRISGKDGYGKDQTATIPFQQHFRGEAAVLAHEISSTGRVGLRGEVQMGAKEFRASFAESGGAVLDQRHDRFDMKRLVSHGIQSLKGRSDNQLEAAAIAAHRASVANGR